MRKFRQKYYDFFSKFYDRFIAMHSPEAAGEIKAFFADTTEVRVGDRVLDLCTGTGSLLPYLKATGGAVIGLDFSRGMLSRAREKMPDAMLIQADVSHLPFKARRFDAVTCTHAFYELKGEAQEKCLLEICRLLKPGKRFVMMEHDVPKSKMIRMLFYIRLMSMGWRKAVEILKHEEETLGRYFSSVEKLRTGSGRSKILICTGPAGT